MKAALLSSLPTHSLFQPISPYLFIYVVRICGCHENLIAFPVSSFQALCEHHIFLYPDLPEIWHIVFSFLLWPTGISHMNSWGGPSVAVFNMQSSMYFRFILKNTQIIHKNRTLDAMQF